MNEVTVRVPATVANLGPGFDCMGLAVAWHNRITLAPAGETTILVTGPGEDRIPRDEHNLVLRAVRAVEAAAGASRSEWSVVIANDAPYGRGFGSSAAAIVGGVVAAQAFLPSDVPALRIAGEIEGHLDNVSAALLGGITVSGYSPDDALRLAPPPGLKVLACVAAERLSTKQARGVLPQDVPFATAVHNTGRAALLAAALATGEESLLLAATEDRLHQDARFAMAPAAGKLCAALRAGGYAAFLSGAGPSVSALVDGLRIDGARSIAASAAPDGWDVRVLDIDAAGATIL